VPKVTEEHRARRREEILDAARRCFSRYGYEGATVARLEAETGLSRGAIFNYFERKEDIFVALVERDSERIGRIWVEDGYEAALRTLLAEDPDWLGVYLETGRRLRTDSEFRERRFQAGRDAGRQIEGRIEREREEGTLRDDVSQETLQTFMALVMDGLATRAAAGVTPKDTDELLAFVGDAIAARPRTRVRRSP
jgi:AcrR family transcriptional regulator